MQSHCMGAGVFLNATCSGCSQECTDTSTDYGCCQSLIFRDDVALYSVFHNDNVKSQ